MQIIKDYVVVSESVVVLLQDVDQLIDRTDPFEHSVLEHTRELGLDGCNQCCDLELVQLQILS